MGRPLGALKGRTEQANDFARWLRKITTGVTVRTLETDFPYAKSSWSGFRDGSRLPSTELVEQVTARYLREPAMRERQLAHGVRLLTAAQLAAKELESRDGDRELPVPPLPGPRRADPMTAALLRLDDARLRQIEAMQKLAASERRREKLEDMVSVLEERCTLLEGERDRAREDAHAELQHELKISIEYRRQADEKLEHARQAEEKAYHLRLAAEKQVTLERMALRRIDQDAAPPPITGSSPLPDLNLPPLHQIHELLEAAQEQLDAQDEELHDLGEQIDLARRQGAEHEKRPPTQTLRGHVVEGTVAGRSQDVLEQRPENSEKPLTSKNGPRNGSTTDTGPDSHTTETASAVDAVHSQPTELVIGLEAVTTPAALSTALSQLLQRAGSHSIMNLTQEAFPGSLKDDLILMAVMRWIDGDALPDTWPHLESLVRAMGATDHEVSAFRQAYTRIIGVHSFASAPYHDLADLPATGRRPLGFSNSPARKPAWTMAVLATFVTATLTTGYTAGLQSVPRPDLWKLIGYGAMVLIVCSVTVAAAVRVRISSDKAKHPASEKHSVGVGLGISLLAFPLGLTVPWILDSDAAGRWFANLIGLV